MLLAAPSSKPFADLSRPNRIIESMTVRPRGVLIATALAAIVVFAAVQDRVTAAGARRYVALQRAALAGRGPAVTVDEIMRPAIAQSVREGLWWGGAVLVSGVGIAAAVAARGVVASDPGSRVPDPGARQL
jgi:hypothetical protein